jgi:hypothetical protein
MKLKDRKKHDIPTEGRYKVTIFHYKDWGIRSDKEYYYISVIVSYQEMTHFFEKDRLTYVWWAKHLAKKAIKKHKRKLVEDAKQKPDKLKDLVYYRN